MHNQWQIRVRKRVPVDYIESSTQLALEGIEPEIYKGKSTSAEFELKMKSEANYS